MLITCETKEGRIDMKKVIILLCATILLASCAKSASTPYGELSQRAFDAWVAANRQAGWTETALGSWIISMDDDAEAESTGSVDDYPYVRLDYMVTDLQGNVSSTTDKALSQQLGSDYYQPYYYFGPQMTYRGTGSMYAGLDEVISAMHVGGHCKVVIPGWLLTSDRHSTKQEYIDAMSESVSPLIYEFTIREKVADTQEWEMSLLQNALAGETARIDTLAEGVYYICEVSTDEPDTEMSSASSIYLDYICRRIDGQGVDTTIADSAKVYGTWKSSSTYSPIVVNWGSTASDITITSSSTKPVTGFGLAVFEMQPHEKGRVYMTSSYAYSSSGSGKSIPSFCPIVFDLEMVDDPDDD